MGTSQQIRRRASSGVDEILALHRSMNPVPGNPIIVGLDSATGQLFFCSAKGLCWKRDRLRLASGEPMLRP